MLQVTGILLKAASCGKPSLRNPKLDQMAGKVESVQRRSQAIRVASRSRTCKMRKQLVKSMNNLSVAPTTLSFFSKHLEGKKEGLGENGLCGLCFLHRTTPGRHKAMVGGKGSKAHRTGKAKGSAKGKARPRHTRKTPLIGSTTLKSEIVCLESPSSDTNRRRTEDGTGEPVAASDPISDVFTQVAVSVAGPPREKKRSFAQAELEEKSPGQDTTEDDLRRKQGPPKASPGAVPEETGIVELQSTNKCCQSHVGGHELGGEASLPNPAADKPVLPAETPPCGLEEAERVCHHSAPRTARCRALPGTSAGKGNQSAPYEAEAADAPIVGRYGVVSLFDGVSTVMPILKKKFGYPPVAAILAECDLSLGELVCTEFGYRSDEKWGYTQDGSAVLYLKDVHAIIKGNCQLLQELVQMFPDCKWVIVGGSPCQDLTFAGPLRGVLGLIGPSSRLFFVLLCDLCHATACRACCCQIFSWERCFDAEIHLDAFCQLLGLPLDQHGRYVWDPWDFGFQITRRRNFFRNYDDIEDIELPILVFGQDFGPLVDQRGNNVSFAPLLRTREVLPYGMLRSSWTLYQPHALVWDYIFWNGKTSFGKACKLGPNRLPNLKWEQVVPPPFLKAWIKFLQVCESRSVRGNDMDAIISPLLPLFHCQCYSIPFRVLKEEEVTALSGLHEVWTRISPEDAEALPEHLVRNYCGKCFHPALKCTWEKWNTQALGCRGRWWTHYISSWPVGGFQSLRYAMWSCGSRSQTQGEERKIRYWSNAPSFPNSRASWFWTTAFSCCKWDAWYPLSSNGWLPEGEGHQNWEAHSALYWCCASQVGRASMLSSAGLWFGKDFWWVESYLFHSFPISRLLNLSHWRRSHKAAAVCDSFPSPVPQPSTHWSSACCFSELGSSLYVMHTDVCSPGRELAKKGLLLACRTCVTSPWSRH